MGVDLGGTNVRIALGDEKGRIFARFSEKTEKTKGPEGVSGQIINLIRSVQTTEPKAKQIQGIGIGSSGPLDMKKGGLMKPTNIPFDFVPLVEPLKEAFHLPTYLLNDCASAVVGEKYFGAGMNHENLTYITISTGIGGGVFIDGHLLTGKDGNAHEIGHLTINCDGQLICGCGKKGHWEAYCSGNGIPNYVRWLVAEKSPADLRDSLLLKAAGADLKDMTSKTLYDAAKAGDPLSLEFLSKIGFLNAVGFACVIDAYDPSLITVGGTITLKNSSLVINPIKRQVGEHARNRIPDIRITPLGDDIGLCGALAHVFHPDQ